MSSTGEIPHGTDWQGGIGTIQDALKYALKNAIDSDVAFLVGTGKELDDGKEEKELIKAHKFVLSMRSSIFAAQFRFNESSGQNSPIDVNDNGITASAFAAMLGFLYTNDLSMIGEENIVGVYCAAKKYLLHVLVEKCIGMSKTMLNLQNVFDMLKMAKLHDEEILVDNCWAFIGKNIGDSEMAKVVVLALGRDEMGEMLARDKLECTKEILLFDYLVKWATKQCENAGILEPTGEELRAKMGPLFYAIRFPLVEPMDFINEIVPLGILNNAEITAMLLHYAKNADEGKKEQQHPLPFSDRPRAIQPRENNKLMDKFWAKKIIEMLNEKMANLKEEIKDLKWENKRMEKKWKENDELREKLALANQRLRTRGMPEVQ